MVDQTKAIVESNSFIILDKYTNKCQSSQGHQSEAELERELIQDLQNQGYEYLSDISNPDSLLKNARLQIQRLNSITFTDQEWQRFLDEYLDKKSEGIIDKTRKIHDDYIHDFVLDDGVIKNIFIVDKKNISRNKLQVINQFEQTGTQANRYDVTILVNGLPLVQVELKKRGIAIREAFNQVHRYSKESFNSNSSLFKYLQLFVISNGTDSRYFANTTKRDKNSFDFTINWALADNSPIKDLKDFTATFFQNNTLLNILLKYCVFDTSNSLLVMRPYQIAATERIMWKINGTHLTKMATDLQRHGYVWHTTGSGKTLTSFKAAQLATELPFVDKVFFVVDRKDLDYQTMKEYQRFSPDSVNGSNKTAELKANIEKNDNKIIVTTIQKLNNLMREERYLPIYKKRVVFIFDECHRSQFGEAQKNLKMRFEDFNQFGFTGTPIFTQNALGDETTASVFGEQLHAYVITDAIRDEKVLKFKVDYNSVHPESISHEKEIDEEELTNAEKQDILLNPDRIRKITKHILEHFKQKTHRLQVGNKGFNAIFAVSNVKAAMLYYEAFKLLQRDCEKPLKLATIYSFAANEEKMAIGDIPDESFDVSLASGTAKEFLVSAINDYNEMFKTNFSVDGEGFQNYYRDLAKKVKDGDIDILIVVGMFLTGFDAPTLNTLYVDKNLRYHGLIQAFSRTNRIYNATKTFGNIVTFRDLEQATKDAITLFGNTDADFVVLEKNYSEYMNGFTDLINGREHRGFIQIVKELENRFPDPATIDKEEDKKAFAKLFGEYLRAENLLQNFDEFSILKAYHKLNQEDPESLNRFKINMI